MRLTAKKIEEIKTELNRVQGKCSARTLDMGQILTMVWRYRRIQRRIKGRGSLHHGSINGGGVSNSYNGGRGGDTTSISFRENSMRMFILRIHVSGSPFGSSPVLRFDGVAKDLDSFRWIRDLPSLSSYTVSSVEVMEDGSRWFKITR